MKVFTKKGIIQKIIVLIIFVMLFNFIVPNISLAGKDKDDNDNASEIFGRLFTPIKELLLGVTDAVIWGIQYIMYGMSETFIDYYHFYTKLANANGESGNDYEGIVPVHLRLPIFNISPEEMFSNNIPLLDVNFFNPAGSTYNEYKTKAEKGKEIGRKDCVEATIKNKDNAGNILDKDLKLESAIEQYLKDYMNYQSDNINVIVNSWTIPAEQYADKLPYVSDDIKVYTSFASWYNEKEYYEAMILVAGTYEDNKETNAILDFYVLEGTVVTFESIITEVPDISSGIKVESSSSRLQPIISKWYYALRNFAIVALLSILVYIAIRIIISSTSEDRAKYKSRLMDWLVAMCLIFTMHYIMSFAVTLTEEITKAVNSMNEKYNYTIQNEPGDTRLLSDYYKEGENIIGVDTIEWSTNLMGKVRLDLQMMSKDYTATQKLLHNFGFIVIYMGLVMYTVLFLFRYFKRLIILAFLTIIAPLVVMTYPLDKIHDNKAKGFNTWLKEYIFNLLIQPVHLILYTVLIGTAIDFAGDNILYSLVAFGFILQAEKIMMKFFGFNKASTVSNTSAALGGALAMKGISSLTKRIGSSNKQPKGEKQEEKGKSTKITQASRKPDKDINELMNSVFGGTMIGLGGGGNLPAQPNPAQAPNPMVNNNPPPSTNVGGSNSPMPIVTPGGTNNPMPNVNPMVPDFPPQANDAEMENTSEQDNDSEEQSTPIGNNNSQGNMGGINNSQNVPNTNSQNFENNPESGTNNSGRPTANGSVGATQGNNENYEPSRSDFNRQRNSNNSNEYQSEAEAREKLARLARRGQAFSGSSYDLPNNDKRTLTMPKRAWQRNKICRTKSYWWRSKRNIDSRINRNWCNNRFNCWSSV